MKLWYDRKSKDPTYFVQKGYRNGKKTTTKKTTTKATTKTRTKNKKTDETEQDKS